MRKNIRKKICLILAIALLGPAAPFGGVRVFAEERQLTEEELAVQSLLRTCLWDIYGARTEQTRIAREYLGSVQDLARVNPDFNAEIAPAGERLNNAIEAERIAKEEFDNANLDSSDMNREFPRVYLTPGLSTQPVSVTIPVKQACRIAINGIDAFSLLSTGRPCDPGSLLGLVSFIEPYATYGKWHVTAHFYGYGQLVDSVELSGEVKDPKDFKRLDDFVQAFRPGVEGATFQIFVADNHSIMVAWNTDGSVTVTDFNNFPQKPETTTKKSSSGDKSNSDSSNTSNSSSGGSNSADSSNTSNSSSGGSNSVDSGNTSNSSSGGSNTSDSNNTANSSGNNGNSQGNNGSGQSDSTIVSSNTDTASQSEIPNA